jgi:ABC-type polysaccharide/polyol phosphate transport system ATPase subunit
MIENTVSVDSVSKSYRIWHTPRGRLLSACLHAGVKLLPALRGPVGRWERCHYHDFQALQDVSFQVRKGEAVGIIGRNGSGKSTLLQIVAGTLMPTKGTVNVAGRVAALLELGSGFNPEYTGRENVFLNASLLGLTEEETRERFDDIAAFADIGEFIEQPVKTYSSGMAVRLAFAVVAHIDPDVLIIDEALAVGDAVFQAKCYQRFREVRERGATVLLVTHDIGAVVRVCDRAIVLDHGRLVAEGTPKEMADEYRRVCAASVTTLPAEGIPAATHSEERPGIHWLAPLSTTQEYGSGQASIEGFAVEGETGGVRTSLLSGEQITLRIRAQFRQSCAAPIIAFGIRDLAGIDLCGSNTWFEEQDIGPVVAGEWVEARFRFRLPIQSGNYHLCLACTEVRDEGIAVHHRMYDVAVLEVKASRRFVGSWDVRPIVAVSRGVKSLDTRAPIVANST